MRKLLLLLLVWIGLGFAQNRKDPSKEKEQINNLLDAWHNAAAEAKYDTYFSFMTNNCTFIGTDATENWQQGSFRSFAKPYFDKGKAWNFKVLERHIYFSKDMKTAWFDELLDTPMKICRGSGVLLKSKKQWKIDHCVLSMTVPNNNTNEVIKIKEEIESETIQQLRNKKL